MPGEGDVRTGDEITLLYLDAGLYGLGTAEFLVLRAGPSNFTGATVTLPYLGLGGLAPSVVAVADYLHAFRFGAAHTIATGMWFGLEEGIVWAVYDTTLPNDQAWDTQTMATVIWGGASIGTVAGVITAATATTTPGRASLVHSTALWTSVLAGTATAASMSDQRAEGGMLAAAVGLNAGLVGGLVLAPRVSPSVARVRVIDLAGLGGGIAVGGVALGIDPGGRNPQVLFASTAVGVGAGLALGTFLTRTLEDEPPRAGAPKTTTAEWFPMLSPTRGGATVGFAGMLE
jgi:hypothetical protein